MPLLFSDTTPIMYVYACIICTDSSSNSSSSGVVCECFAAK